MIRGLPEEEFFNKGHGACGGCGPALVMRTALKACGKNTIVAHNTGCMEVISTPYPLTSWKLPWIHVAFENAAAVISGVEKSLIAKKIRDKINLLVIGGDGSTFDIGFQALSGAIERKHKFTYLNYDNEFYANTGYQRSSATPIFTNTSTTPASFKMQGKLEPKKLMPLIIASHGVDYVATASLANQLDLYTKVQKALKVNGPSFIHVLSPCPIGWHQELHNTIEISRLAVKTRVQPIYEIEKGILKFNQKISDADKLPVEKYLSMQGRFKHLTKESIAKIQQYVDDRYNFLLSIEGKKVFDNVLSEHYLK